MKHETICPACGQHVRGQLHIDAIPAVSPLFRRILVVMQQWVGEYMTSNQIAAEVYADDPNGGPMTAGHSIRNTICRHRIILEPYGWRIEGRSGAAGGGYRLVRNTPGATQ